MFSSITTRLIVLLTCCSALILGVGMAVDYHLSRGEILDRLQVESRDTISSVVIDLENLLDGVEGTTLFLGRILQQRDYSLPGLKQMLRDIVENNEDIFGAAIALNPALADAPQGFAPYYYKKDGVLAFSDLSLEQSGYWQQGWYADAISAGRPVWIEPYFDAGGGDVWMTTFSVPVYRFDEEGNRFPYAVVTADITLDELHEYLQRLRLGDMGFGILLSSDGKIISSRSADSQLHTAREVIGQDLDPQRWTKTLQALRSGQEVTRQITCPGANGNCTVRMSALVSTGWPVGVIYSEREILAPLREFEIKMATIGFTTLVLMALAVFFVTRRLTGPLVTLAGASDDIARGELNTPLPSARGDDEVARLVRSFTAMKKDLKSYISDLETVTASRSRLEGELAAAREIQMSMLPQGGEAFEQTAVYELWARVRPAKSVGGDLYSYLCHDNALFIAVGDVSDKGVPAALFMARAISLIQPLLNADNNPAAAMAQLNNALETGNDNCMFVTLFLGILDLHTLQLRFASAGHTPPGLLRRGEVTEMAQEDGPALGLARDLDYPLNMVQLEGSDRLAIFTDGIDEAFDEQSRMFGIERFQRYFAQTAQAPVSEAGPALFQAVDDHAGAMAQSDDITLLLLQLNPQGPKTPARPDKAVQHFSGDPHFPVRALAWTEQTLEALSVPTEARMELTLVIEEIVTNIARYGNVPAGSTIELAVELGAETVTIQTGDSGVEFNPLQDGHRSALGADIESAEIGGLGVHLITQLTDQQHYQRVDGRNILRVVKSLHVDTGLE